MTDRMNHSILREDVEGVFDRSRFAIERRPVEVTPIIGRFLDDVPSCLDMLIKLPGGDIVVPMPYAADPAIAEIILRAVMFEDALLPSWDDRYLYLTVDRRFVSAGGTHRNGGWHFDGMQGVRFTKKLPVCHQYVVSDRLCTEFTDAPTNADGLGETTHNWFDELGGQVPSERPVITPAPMQMVCMSAYQLHRSPVCVQEGWRTFVRLDVSCKQQDRTGNSPNPLLPAPWPFVDRPLPAGLERNVTGASWEGAETFKPRG